MLGVAIIGGGIAGCETALELANKGHKVIIYEQDSDILQGTSAKTFGRLGLGYHYFHSETAEHYMRQTVEFMKKHSDCFIGDESTPYLQHGRYFIVKNSLVDAEELMANYDAIGKKFEKMCQKDQSNNIFGTTHLSTVLYRSDFKYDVNSDKVAFAFETEERLLDWQKFSKKLKDEIINHPNIEFRTGSPVQDVSSDESGKFVVKQGEVENKFDYVVNCTWQSIEALNEKLGIGDAHLKKDDPAQAIISRLKLLVEIEIPEGFKEKPSMFFCVGPHAMFSNLGDGIGRITFAPITNFGATTKVGMPSKLAKLIADENLIRDLREKKNIPEEAELTKEEKEDLVMEHINEVIARLLDDGLNEDETKKYGQEIIDGVAEYIPWIKDAKLLSVIPGIVKSRGSVDIEDKNSPFHQRDYSGVEEQQLGWIDNAAMKLFYCLGNAKEVLEIIERQERARTEAKKAIKKVVDFVDLDQSKQQGQATHLNQELMGQFFINHLQKHFKSADFEEEMQRKLTEDLKCTAEKKGLVIREITQLAPQIKERSGINE